MVRASKRLGQHFLRDLSVVDKAVEALELTPSERVLEIGPGQGVLTTALAERAGTVVAVELDRGLAASLRVTMQKNVEIVEGDALEVDLAALGPFDKVAGNLPYQISSPLTFRILDLEFRRAVFLYQWEFAVRLAANVGEEAYGRLSVARAYRCTAKMLRKVRPGAFVPPPQVMSGLVRLDPFDDAPFDVGPDVRFFDDVVRELFAQRRKTLRRALSNQSQALGLGKLTTDEAVAILQEADADADRVEELSPEGYGRLAKALHARRVTTHAGA